MSRELAYRCPDCNRALHSAQGMEVATQVVKRTCRRCGSRWQIVIVPNAGNIHGQGAWFDSGTFTRIAKSQEAHNG